MTIEEAIKWHERKMHLIETLELPESQRGPTQMALSALRTQQEAEKNEPLTQEEFLSMEGKPVWIVPAYEAEWEPQWTIVHKDFLTVLPDSKNPKRMLEIFNCFYAFRHPPKEAPNV